MYFDDFGGSKNTRKNSYFLKDASYLRLKNLTIGYTIPVELTRKMLVERIRIFFSGDNLATITNYPNWIRKEKKTVVLLLIRKIRFVHLVLTSNFNSIWL